MIAVIKTGGKQYIVREGQTITVEKLAVEKGPVTFSDVLLVDNDGKTTVGTPTVKGASVAGTVTSHGKGPKVTVVKYKAKVRYRRKLGHRQAFSKVTIDKIASV